MLPLAKPAINSNYSFVNPFRHFYPPIESPISAINRKAVKLSELTLGLLAPIKIPLPIDETIISQVILFVKFFLPVFTMPKNRTIDFPGSVFPVT